MTSNPTLQLQGFTYPELFNSKGLIRLDQRFFEFLNEQNASLHDELLVYRSDNRAFTAIKTSELLISCAEVLENFLA